MPLMKVIKPGFQSTIQDLGRFGFSDLGISISGAADVVSFRIGNLLLGNEESSSAIEMTLVGGEFLFDSDTIIAITGSDFQPTIDRIEIPLWTSIFVRSGQTISFGATQSGARCYLCIKGGFEIDNILGSFSTHLLTSIGGYKGRVLLSNDEINYAGCNFKYLQPLKVKREIALELMTREKIFITNAPQTDNFSPETLNLFSSSVYSVSEETNRMGLRLTGPMLEGINKQDIITEGVSLGAIQVSHDGNPIILFVEHQTTGGYPKIANVISAHLHKVGQLRPRDEIQFSFVSIEKAYEMRMHLESLISPMSLTLA
ncbi:MAG: biotin-dependent carboxyltransferase family protein [Ignavibacteriales bacterium]|nr:biotin-dependent carboxyltransferase family protein [Ignavibacteriales bacterium]